MWHATTGVKPHARKRQLDDAFVEFMLLFDGNALDHLCTIHVTSNIALTMEIHQWITTTTKRLWPGKSVLQQRSLLRRAFIKRLHAN